MHSCHHWPKEGPAGSQLPPPRVLTSPRGVRLAVLSLLYMSWLSRPAHRWQLSLPYPFRRLVFGSDISFPVLVLHSLCLLPLSDFCLGFPLRKFVWAAQGNHQRRLGTGSGSQHLESPSLSEGWSPSCLLISQVVPEDVVEPSSSHPLSQPAHAGNM